MNVAILITNPNHHLELTIDVARRVQEGGDEVKYVSLCEMRRMPSPVDVFEREGFRYITFGKLPDNIKPSSGKKSLGKSDSNLRKLVQNLFWRLKLKPFISKAFLGVDKVLLLNDTAFPGNKICNWLNQQRLPFYLLQEGIRFPLPTETQIKYGGGGAAKVFAWGQRSADHFRDITKQNTEVIITGSPRFDSFLKQIEASSGLGRLGKKLGVFTNPIDDQGFCNKDEKLELFESFVKRSANYINANNISLGIKCHPREDISEYLRISRNYIDTTVELSGQIIKAILEVDAGVIMASTVGLELLCAHKKVAQLEIPGFGYVFDYTDDTSVVKIPTEGDFDLGPLFEKKTDLKYFHEHIRVGKSSEVIYRHVK